MCAFTNCMRQLRSAAKLVATSCLTLGGLWARTLFHILSNNAVHKENLKHSFLHIWHLCQSTVNHFSPQRPSWRRTNAETGCVLDFDTALMPAYIDAS